MVSKIFHSSEQSDYRRKLRCLYSQNQLITIQIEKPQYSLDYIELDIDTAIQFSKELRKEIAKAKEAKNG